MLLIIEIILTIFAWNKGWKWLALLPVGIAFFIGFIAGAGVGTSGGSIDNLGWMVIFDIFAVVALIVMVSVKPKNKDEAEKIEPAK